ncbi:M81 family metallopeptidase [Bordetella pertussis]|uniref:M81 family metallopeptidase n=1 Tax=Bordetella pertussis TaxID=520 RepID=UPI00366DDB3A
MSSNAPKVAILGFHLESNAFSPLSVEADFLAQCWEQGEDITRLARGASRLPSEVPGFYARMDELGAWTPAPLIVIGAPPGGPASAGVWRRFLAEAETRLRAALPVDAVYVANHGASSAEGQDDTEGELMGRLRAIVGPGVPIVASHDLHCNVSEQTVQALDGLISYRTNPHVDQRERAADAADMIHEILGGTRMVSAYVRLPLTPPSVTLLTSSGPYADLVALGASLIQKPDEGPIANVSVCSGFVFSDLPKCGLMITVTARGDLQAARRAALRIARAGWADRKRYVANTVEVARAVELARAAGQPLLFADVADNPGGGGGNTAWLLRAFHEARIPGVVLGVFVDPELAAQAAQLGEGAEFDAVFNRIETDYARRYQARARVLRLTDGEGMGWRGILRGRKFSLGASCLLELVDSGMRVVVGSLRRQLAEPAMLEMHGIDIARAGHVVVKSRGHYRAGFDEFFPDDRIHDVDSLGLTTPNLKQIAFKRLPRPVWPLDDAAAWQEPDWAEGL